MSCGSRIRGTRMPLAARFIGLNCSDRKTFRFPGSSMPGWSALRAPSRSWCCSGCRARIWAMFIRSFRERKSRRWPSPWSSLQATLNTLPRGAGFGYVRSYESGFPYPSWQAFLASLLARSGDRITGTGAVSLALVEQVRAAMPALDRYFAAVEPMAFLDDITTKNVLVQEGRLSGIVDVDHVCFGDPLLTIALTQTALASEGFELDYTEAWIALLSLAEEQQSALRFYTMLFCVNFLSETGQSFNRTEPIAMASDRNRRLEETLQTLRSWPALR